MRLRTTLAADGAIETARTLSVVGCTAQKSSAIHLLEWDNGSRSILWHCTAGRTGHPAPSISQRTFITRAVFVVYLSQHLLLVAVSTHTKTNLCVNAYDLQR